MQVLKVPSSKPHPTSFAFNIQEIILANFFHYRHIYPKADFSSAMNMKYLCEVDDLPQLSIL